MIKYCFVCFKLLNDNQLADYPLHYDGCDIHSNNEAIEIINDIHRRTFILNRRQGIEDE